MKHKEVFIKNKILRRLKLNIYSILSSITVSFLKCSGKRQMTSVELNSEIQKIPINRELRNECLDV